MFVGLGGNNLPKQTFLNLPEEKKQTLNRVLMKEFSRVPLFEASISNIVKEAGIPRGSFYQYFEDKDDAFFYILNDFVIKISNQFVFLLHSHNGDLFQTMIDLYRMIIEEENISFLKNAFLNMTHKIEYAFEKIFKPNEHSHNDFEKISSLINRANLNISNDQELTHVIRIISTITFRNFVEKFAHDLPSDVALDNYIIEINLIKRGLSKETTSK